MADGDQNSNLVLALSHLVDDEEAMLAARQWAVDQLLAGETPEAVCDQMLQEGWAISTVEEIVEQARRQTRRDRGVLTREDVLRNINPEYRQATGGLSVAFRSGLFGLYGFTTGFMAALRQLRKLKYFGRSNR